MNQELSPIEKLPAELLYSIIDYVPASVFAIQMASKTLKHAVDSYASRPKTIQLVDQLEIMTQHLSITFSFNIPIWKTNLFELRLRTNDLPCNRITRVKHSGIAVHRVQTYRLIFHDTEDVDLLSRLATCMGGLPSTAKTRGTIGSVQIMMLCADDARLWRSSKILAGLNFDTLLFTHQTLKDAHTDFICSIVDDHAVNRLDLVVGKNATSDPKKVLLEFSSRLRSLLIRQVNPYHKWGWPVKLMFGDIDWPSVILEMLADSRKLDKLFLDGYQDPDFITGIGELKLRRCLPKLRKRVWFTANLPRSGEDIDCIENDYAQRAKIFKSSTHQERREGVQNAETSIRMPNSAPPLPISAGLQPTSHTHTASIPWGPPPGKILLGQTRNHAADPAPTVNYVDSSTLRPNGID